MRKALVLTLLMGLIIFVSCKDELSPFGESNEKFILNCIVRPDTNYQTLTLATNYMVDNFDPYSNTTDPTIKGAQIRLWEGNDKVVFFKDTIIDRDANSKYLTPFTIYHARGFQPAPGSKLEIEAILPNGRKLTASTTTPLKPTFTYLNSGGQGDTLLPPADGRDYFRFQWGDNYSPSGTIYLPRVFLVYKVVENGNEIRKTKMIPKQYITFKGTEYPEYFSTTYIPVISISMDVLSRCLKEISAGDEDKGRYKIYALMCEVIAMDSNLSAYINATNKNKDPFAVKLYESDFTNISGGLGIFGVSYYGSAPLDITGAFVRTFGYEHGYRTD